VGGGIRCLQLRTGVSIVGVGAMDVDFHAVGQPIVSHAKRIRIPHIVFHMERMELGVLSGLKKNPKLMAVIYFEKNPRI